MIVCVCACVCVCVCVSVCLSLCLSGVGGVGVGVMRVSIMYRYTTQIFFYDPDGNGLELGNFDSAP